MRQTDILELDRTAQQGVTWSAVTHTGGDQAPALCEQALDTADEYRLLLSQHDTFHLLSRSDSGDNTSSRFFWIPVRVSCFHSTGNSDRTQNIGLMGEGHDLHSWKGRVGPRVGSGTH